MSETQANRILTQQIAYYRARANEYDEWFLRQGRYDHGPEHNLRWFDEIKQVQQALAQFAPRGHVLELACGTGLWTAQLAQYAQHLTAVDAAPEMLAINRERVGSAGIRYIEADLFTWQPDRLYDVVFFGFWLSHVPPEQFNTFWNLARSALRPGGRVFFVDSRYEQTGTATDQLLRDRQATTSTRRLNDGREFQIVKVFYQPDTLTARLAEQGWRIQVQETAQYFLYGFGSLEDR